MTFAEVAVNVPPVRGTFHYHLPPDLEGRLLPGHLVTAPFGHQRVQGVVLSLLTEAEVPETRPVEALVDSAPVLTAAQLALGRWLAAETRTPLIDCLTLMLPPGLSQQADSLYAVADPAAAGDDPSQGRLLHLLMQRGPLRGRQIQHALPRAAWRRAAEALVRRGALSRTPVLEAPRIQPRQVRTAALAGDPIAPLPDSSALGRPGSPAARRRSAVLTMLAREPGPVEVSWIYAETGAGLPDLRFLEARDRVVLGAQEVWRDPLADVDFVPADPPSLTRDQAAVWEAVQGALEQAADGADVPPHLLHGVTGSGKTEIYLRAVADCLAGGRQAIILVPEIALTPQTVRRFLARFPGQVGLLHSQLTPGQRYDTWRRARAGRLGVVVGPRSALFVPLPRIGLIVLDEAHDDSYKEQGQAPRYDARPAAAAYARILGALCLLGTATPDVVTAYQAAQGKVRRLVMPQRILGHRTRVAQQSARFGVASRYVPAGGEAEVIDLPPVRIIDLRQELRSGNASLFSRALQQALAETLAAKQQAILFLNRRGSATYVFCRDCGAALRCPRCETPLTFHGTQEELQCHHCGYRRKMPRTCPTCGSPRIKQFGAGTQRVEAEVQRLFPTARTLRWDWDATRAVGAHDVLLAHFANHRADVLVGTQMIAKGLDLPLVTLVGVVSADTGLNLPDFRAGERTFQVLTQVAGRAGRGLLGGRVILQTFQPDHYVLRAAAGHDYQAFYAAEIQYRRELGYPPFRRLARLVFRHPRREQAQHEAARLAGALRAQIARQEMRVDLIGPAPCFYARARGLYRWQIVIRAADPVALVPDSLPEGWSLDVDPVTLL